MNKTIYDNIIVEKTLENATTSYKLEIGDLRFHLNKPLERIGVVGLIYPSNYGYATSGGRITSRADCHKLSLDLWNQERAKECKENNWLYKIDKRQWTLTSLSIYITGVTYIWNDGSVNGNNAVYELFIYPTLF